MEKRGGWIESERVREEEEGGEGEEGEKEEKEVEKEKEIKAFFLNPLAPGRKGYWLLSTKRRGMHINRLLHILRTHILHSPLSHDSIT